MSDMESLLNTLSPQQREAVTATDGPVLILAGAGSGKTRVITYRIANLLETGRARPWEVLALTFTNKAAREMKERVASLLGDRGGDIWVTTFHAFGARIMRRHAELMGYESEFAVYDSDDTTRLVRRIFKDKGIKDARITPTGFLSWMDRRSWSVNPPDSESYLDRRYLEIYDEYRAGLKQANAMDFKDLLTLPMKLFREHEDVRVSYQERFKYVLVDEYQDTNQLQYQMVKILSGHHRNLTAVGDEDQSIYSWRGADIRNILDFESDYKDHRVCHLTQNYRSTQRVLDAANSLIRYNHQTHRKEEGLVAASGDEGERLRYYLAATDEEEARWVVHTIHGMIDGGIAPERIAVFYRTHAQSRRLEERMFERQVPFRIFGGIPFFAKKEVKDLLAYLRIIQNPRDDINLVRAIMVPKRGIGETTLTKARITAQDAGVSLFEILRRGTGLPKTAARRAKSFTDLILELKGLSEEVSLDQLVTVLIDRIDYREYLSEQGREDREEILNEFKNMVAEFENRPLDASLTEAITTSVEKSTSGSSAPSWGTEEGGLGGPGSGLSSTRRILEAFLEGIALYEAVENLGKSGGTVTLMTVHNAKGLEYDYVFIVGLEERLFPHGNSYDDPLQMEEERRLFYVGVTRTMRRLYMSGARMRALRGYPEPRTPSRFLREIDPKTLEVRGLDGWTPATQYSS